MSTTSHTPPQTRWPFALTIGIVGSLMAGLLVLAFLWPITTVTPRDIRIGIVAPTQLVPTIEAGLAGQAEAVVLVAAGSRDEAIQSIRTRDTIGALVIVDPRGAPEVLTAPAAGSATTQIMDALADNAQPRLGPQATAAEALVARPTITPVVPLAATDRTGAGINAASFPLTLGGLLGGVLVSLLVVGPARRLAALVTFAIVAGLAFALVLQTWFGFVPGDFGITSFAMGLSALATSAFVVGCAAVFGRPGIGLGGIVAVLIANPLSGASIPWQFLAQPWGAIGQYLVPGASARLIRDLAYFPDANTGAQWWTLVGWVALGVALVTVGHFRSQASMNAARRETTA